MRQRCVLSALLVALASLCGATVGCATTAFRGGTARERRLVVLISLDGARPDGIERARTPHIDELIAAGAAAADARSIYPFLTLPSHIAMLTGLRLYHHGVRLNAYVEPMPPMPAPSVLDICDRHGLVSLMLAGKMKLGMIRPPSDPPTASRIVPLERIGPALREAAGAVVPQFVFLHSAHPDLEGHTDGWMSPAYLKALTRCDAMLGEVVAWVRASGRWERTLIIITADHGGFAKTHCGEHPGDIAIPWIVSGGLAAGAELPDRVMIQDTAPTILRMLGLPIPKNIDGRSVEGLQTYPELVR